MHLSQGIWRLKPFLMRLRLGDILWVDGSEHLPGYLRAVRHSSETTRSAVSGFRRRPAESIGAADAVNHGWCLP